MTYRRKFRFVTFEVRFVTKVSNVDAICSVVYSAYSRISTQFLSGKENSVVVLCMLWRSKEAEEKEVYGNVRHCLQRLYSHELIGILALSADCSSTQFHISSTGDDVQY